MEAIQDNVNQKQYQARIRDFLYQLKIPHSQFAIRMGVTRQYIHHALHGDEVSAKLMERITDEINKLAVEKGRRELFECQRLTGIKGKVSRRPTNTSAK